MELIKGCRHIQQAVYPDYFNAGPKSAKLSSEVELKMRSIWDNKEVEKKPHSFLKSQWNCSQHHTNKH